MPTPKGYFSQNKEDRAKPEYTTISPSGQFKHALDVRDIGTVSNVVSDLAEAGSTTTVINATAHQALVGDRIRFTSGTHDTLEVDVLSVDTDTITLAQTLSAAVGTGDGFDILRPTSFTVSATGGVVATSGPIQFKLDGAAQEVIEDTVTPANNIPLPVKLLDVAGEVKVNASNLNLEVQLEHDTANPDSVRIGDGTETVAVSASNELEVRDGTARTSLASIDGKIGTGGSLGDVTVDNAGGASAVNVQDGGNSLTVDDGGSTISVDDGGGTLSVDAAALPLPTGAATEATLSSVDTDTSTIAGDTTSIDGKTPALGAAATAASVPVNIASDQTVPVSAASLPLPTGAATEATLVTIDADTGTIAGDTTSIDGKTPALGAAATAASVPVNIASDQTVPVSAASLPLPTGAATEATLSTIDADTSNIATDTSTIAGDTTSIDGKTPALGAAATAASVPVNIANDQTVPVAEEGLDIVDLIDDLGDGAGIVFAANDNIPGSGGGFLQIIASTAADIKKINFIDTTGGFIGLYTGAAASEALKCVIGPGSDVTLDVQISSGTRLTLRRMDSATALSVGHLSMNFLG